MRRLIPALAALLLAGCGYPYTPPALPPVTAPGPAATGALATVAPAERRTPVTILVSLDGFRPDYLRRGNTPNLDALAAGGVQGTMRPSFPALTFSNHTAMITGLYPDRNGIVATQMYDPRRPDVKFTNSDPVQAFDPFWWGESEPLWIAAERNGIHTGVMFWPGSETGHDGVRPDDWMRYDANYTGDKRVRTVLDWMRRPAASRPRFTLMYQDAVDKAGHKFGPFAPETIAAIRDVDSWVGTLVAGLRALGQPANMLVVSDHGMEQVDPARAVLLDSLVPRGSYRWGQWGPFASIDALPGHEAEVAAGLLKPHPLVKCWRKEALPARFHYGHNPRVPQFVCVAEPGAELVATPPTNHGDHAYDPDLPSMTALFLANGPAFRAGAKAPPKFDNVDVYPLLRRLIGLPPAAGIDGTDAPFKDIIAR
ncbi:ectonucleotide pyrophosphatase/phosphodiesterase [Sphingomonas aracearum]|uniref:Alkaline phosphatase family protein n=1 Tax=Sphingomonas aracearum TaxID=2283317 RepID=A0A369VX73_9SPHN|nr:ectonucleotide pyrophosphatase/phosphodiesterase [Sphingomonas aracearum]RDE06733.1 alkaline phosphatase family protein [Sphingomonas aracearum]